MCGRISGASERQIQAYLNVRIPEQETEPNINTRPTDPTAVVTDKDPGTLHYYSWSLIPWFSKTGKPEFSTFNAQEERLESSPMWKGLIGKQHCIIPAAGFYEWQYDDPIKKKGSKPHFIRTKGEPITLFAGLWDRWRSKETGQEIYSCTVIVKPANQMMAGIHNTKERMPAILTKEEAKLWLDRALSWEERKQVLHKIPDEFLEAFPVKKVGDAEEYGKLFC